MNSIQNLFIYYIRLHSHAADIQPEVVQPHDRSGEFFRKLGSNKKEVFYDGGKRYMLYMGNASRN